jgi:hypothetical protein
MLPLLLSVLSSDQGKIASAAATKKPAVAPSLGSARAILLALLAFFSMWFYTERVLIPHQLTSAASEGRPRGNLSDLYPRWLGARELLLHGRDPYTREITREIQIGYYGRPLDPARPHDPKDQAGFAYPVYVSFLLAPTLRLDFQVLRRAFTWVLTALLLVSVPLWLKFLNWHVSRSGLLIASFLMLGSFGAVQGLKLQQLTLLVAAMLAAAVAAVAAGWLTLAGILLALATIKPQLSLVLAGWLMLWALSDWRKRWPLLISFGIVMASLLVGAELVLHGWMSKFLVALRAYTQYTNAESVLTSTLGMVVGLLITAILLLLLARVAGRFRRHPADSPEFALTTVLVLGVTMVIIPSISGYNQVMLLPAILLLVKDWRLIFRMGPAARFLYLVVAAMVIWPWLAAVVLSLLVIGGHPQAAQNHWTIPVYTTIMIPFGIMALLGFYTLGRWHLPASS